MDSSKLRSAATAEELARAASVIARCRLLAEITDVRGETTRTFLSPAMRDCMQVVCAWMEKAGMTASVDAAGNLRGMYAAGHPSAKRLILGSHLDTVPNAGAFDGVLGVMIGLALVESLERRLLPFAIELIGFSDEEGVRFRTPFIGSRALVGRVDDGMLLNRDANGVSLEQAIRGFGLDPTLLNAARLGEGALAYLEFHIEQGPVLESEDLSLGVVSAITGQTRGEMTFTGAANHAGTTPMHLRCDALVGAAEWIFEVERAALATDALVATVGKIAASPDAGNVIPGEIRASLDVRHPDDAVRRAAVKDLVARAESIAGKRCLRAQWQVQMEQSAVALDPEMTEIAAEAVRAAGVEPLRMTSGAGHDAMIVAERLPSAMIFLRSPGGVSHSPVEAVREEDVNNAIAAGRCFLDKFETMVNATHAQVGTDKK